MDAQADASVRASGSTLWTLASKTVQSNITDIGSFEPIRFYHLRFNIPWATGH